MRQDAYFLIAPRKARQIPRRGCCGSPQQSAPPGKALRENLRLAPQPWPPDYADLPNP
jgi:hypothetical protein